MVGNSGTTNNLIFPKNDDYQTKKADPNRVETKCVSPNIYFT